MQSTHTMRCHKAWPPQWPAWEQSVNAVVNASRKTGNTVEYPKSSHVQIGPESAEKSQIPNRNCPQMRRVSNQCK